MTAVTSAALLAGAVAAQPGLPAHDGGGRLDVPAITLASFEPGRFFESVEVGDDGTLYAASHDDGRVIRRTPAGLIDVFATVPATLRGLVMTPHGDLLATAKPKGGPDSVYRITNGGEVSKLAELPDAEFLNGLARVEGDRYLIADSNRGCLWLLDAAAGSAEVWLEHDLLAKRAADNPAPAANGVKLRDGVVVVSNTDKSLVVRVPMNGDGSAGEPEVWAEGVVIDDFDLGPDGTLFGTTHIYNTLVTISPDGRVTTIAGPNDGMTGSTDAQFGRGDDAGSLYVVGDGGQFLPPDGGVVPSTFVRLDVAGVGGVKPTTRPIPRVERLQAFMLTARTDPDAPAGLRDEVGPRYLTYLEANYGRVAFAGQVYGDGRDAPPTARVYVVHAAEEAGAMAFIEGSPYYVEGLYQKDVEIQAFTGMLGTTMGGVAWPDSASPDTPGGGAGE